jgi:PAS domain S-box-containing protein
MFSSEETKLEHVINENKKLKTTLFEVEERLRGISESTFEGIVIHEAGRIVELNDRYAWIHGYQRDDLIGKSLLSLVTAESIEKVKQHIAVGPDQPYEIVALKKDGSTFYAELRGKNITYKGKLCRVSAIQDITEREQMKAKLENYAQNLEHLVKKQTKQLKDAERLAAIG